MDTFGDLWSNLLLTLHFDIMVTSEEDLKKEASSGREF